MRSSLKYSKLKVFLTTGTTIIVLAASQNGAGAARGTPTGDCPESVDKLVFNEPKPDSSGRPNSEIYTVCADGSGRTRLTNSQGYDGAAQWSPDGRRIAFLSNRDTGPRTGGLLGQHLYVMNADGTGVRRVIDRFVGNFAWSPDGHRFAIASIAGVTSDDSADVNRWSFKRDIFVINVDGTGLTNLTQSPGAENFPAWSPDGREIAFGWRGHMGDRVAGLLPRSVEEDWVEIYVMNSDGTGVRRLTFNRLGVGGTCCEDTAPRWSPDSRWIAFVSKRDGNSEIYRMRRDGSDQQRLTRDTTTFEGYPAWSSDGRHIAFNRHGMLHSMSMPSPMEERHRITPDSLFIMKGDGSDPHSLGVSGARPDWRPR